MSESTEAIAARCLEDADFARQVLEGDEYPEVRGAIIADLEDENSVTGYLNPCPMPPAPRERAILMGTLAQQSQIWANWSTLPRANLVSLQRPNFH